MYFSDKTFLISGKFKVVIMTVMYWSLSGYIQKKITYIIP